MGQGFYKSKFVVIRSTTPVVRKAEERTLT